MAHRRDPHQAGYPRLIARFIQLEGGQYGTIDMKALTPHRLEFQLGVDFVQFTRKQAEDLRDAVQMFIDLGVERPHVPRGGEIVEQVEEEVVERVSEVVEQAAPRRRRRRSA